MRERAYITEQWFYVRFGLDNAITISMSLSCTAKVIKVSQHVDIKLFPSIQMDYSDTDLSSVPVVYEEMFSLKSNRQLFLTRSSDNDCVDYLDWRVDSSILIINVLRYRGQNMGGEDGGLGGGILYLTDNEKVMFIRSGMEEMLIVVSDGLVRILVLRFA